MVIPIRTSRSLAFQDAFFCGEKGVEVTGTWSLGMFSLPIACIISSNGSQASVCIKITSRVVETQIIGPLPEVLIEQVWSGTENGHF